MKVFRPLEHHDYGTLDENCACGVCEEWRRAGSAFRTAVTDTKTHARACPCNLCSGKMHTRSVYLSALNRRDLYCEGSWHAANNPDWGPTFMTWLAALIASGQSSGWWEVRAPVLPLSYWFNRYDSERCSGVPGVGSISR